MKPIRSNHKDFLRSQSLTRKRRKKKVLKIWIGVIVVICLVAGLSWLFSLQSIAIKKVIVVGNTNITSTEVQNITNDILNGRYLGVFSKRNAFIYPKRYITETLLSVYPRIEDAIIDTESLEILNIKIKERSAQAIWCAAVLCYLVDEKGYIFAEVIENLNTDEGSNLNEDLKVRSELSGSKRTILRGGDQFVGSEPVGKYIFTERLYSDIIQTVDEMDKIHLSVKEVHVFSRDEIVFILKNGGKLIFSDRKPFDVSLENLRSSINSPVFINPKAKNEYNQFEYIDVRFGNKVFYKLDKSKQEMNVKASSSSKNTI